MLPALIYSTLFVSLVYAQSRVSQAITSALSNDTTLSGDSVKLSPYNLQIVTNDTAAVVTFNLTKTRVNNVGWMAVGTGTRMSNADILLIWPTVAKNQVEWTFSQRTAGGHVMPDPNIKQSREITLLPQLSTMEAGDTSYTLLSFLRPLKPQYETDASVGNVLSRSSVDIVYAYSSVNPGEAKQDTVQLAVHDDAAAITMDLSTSLRGTVTSPSSNNGTATTSGSGDTTGELAPTTEQQIEQPWSHTDTIVTVHALLGTLAWLILSPSAILLARLGRHLEGWVKVHQWLQIGATTILTILSFILGVIATHQYGTHFSDSHHYLGVVLLCLLILQVALGLIIHRLFDSKRIKRPIRNLLHILLGLTLTGLGFIQIYQGFELYAEHGRVTPKAIKIIYYIIVAAFIIALLMSSVRLAIQRKKSGLPLKDAIWGIGRITKNNTQAPAPLEYSLKDMNYNNDGNLKSAWEPFESEKGLR